MSPTTTWNQRGRNTTVAKKPNAARKTATTEMVNERFRNSSSGTIGSAVRDSTTDEDHDDQQAEGDVAHRR